MTIPSSSFDTENRVVAQFEIHGQSSKRQISGNIESWQRDHDFFVNARRVVEQAIGEHMDGSPLKNKGSKVAGSKGGKKGGTAS